MSIWKLTFAILLFLTTLPAIAQDEEKKSEDNQTLGSEETEAKKTVDITEVWKQHAAAVSNRFNLDDKKRDSVVKIYLEVREGLKERVRQRRAMQEESREERIWQSRQSGTYIVPSIDELRLFNKAIFKASEEARKKLAESLVETVEKSLAQRIFPPLAAFDLKVDNLIRVIIEEEVTEKNSYSAIKAIDVYFAESVKARAKIRSDKKAYILANNAARGKLVSALTPMLSEEALKQVSRMVGIKKAPKKRGG